MMHSELKWPYAVLAAAIVSATICFMLALSSKAELHQQWLKIKRLKTSESVALLSALGEQRRFAGYRESYDAVMGNAKTISHDRISLLEYLDELNADISALEHSFSIEPAQELQKADHHLPGVMVSIIRISAEFHHEDHLIDYLWHIDQQQSALLKVVAIDVSILAGGRPASGDENSHLQVEIRLHWFAVSVFELS